MRNFSLFFCLFVCFISCKKEVPLEFTTKTYDFKSENDCSVGNCTYVHFEIPVASGKNKIAKTINKQIFDFVKQAMSFENETKTTSYDTLALTFINHFNEMSHTYPDNAIAWEANFKADHKSISKRMYQITWDYYIFSGGAHGLQANKVFLFDKTTGKTIPTKELFINFDGFKNYAESEFKKQLNITSDLNSAGFTFEKNIFKLPENFYETNNEWILHYNPYEIAPYVQGTTVIKLPKQKVTPFLNPIYFKN